MKQFVKSFQLISIFNFIVFQCNSQDIIIEKKQPKHEFEFLVGYPLLNNIHIYKHSNFPTGNVHEIHAQNQSFNFGVLYSHRWFNNVRYKIGLNYFNNEFKGPELRLFYNSGSPGNDRRYYKMFQIFRFEELRLNVLLSKDFNFQNRTYIRASLGYGIHIFPFLKGKRVFVVSSYYEANQDTSIHYFKPTAVNKEAYRDQWILSSGIVLNSDYHILSNDLYDIYIGLYFKLNSLPADDQNYGSHLFEDPLSTNEYEVAYGLYYQYHFGTHIGVTLKGKQK